MDFPDPKRLPEKSDGDDACTQQMRGSNAKKRDALLIEAVRRAAKGDKGGDLCLPSLSLATTASRAPARRGRAHGRDLRRGHLSDNDVRARRGRARRRDPRHARPQGGRARASR